MTTLSDSEVSSKKLSAGLLGIFLGAIGVHKLVLGYTTSGVIMLVATILTCGFTGFIMGTIGLIEGINDLAKSDQDFRETYIDGTREWF